MSGVSHRSLDWQDQLEGLKAEIARGGYKSATGGFEPNRHRRKYKKILERDPFEGTELESRGKKRTKPNSSPFDEFVEPGVRQPFDSVLVSKQDVITSSDDNGEGTVMSNDRRDQFQSGDSEYVQQGERRLRTDAKRRGQSEGETEDENEELSEEDIAERSRQAKINKRVKKGFLWTIAGVGATAVVGGALAVTMGLLRGHKSNIMNL